MSNKSVHRIVILFNLYRNTLLSTDWERGEYKNNITQAFQVCQFDNFYNFMSFLFGRATTTASNEKKGKQSRECRFLLINFLISNQYKTFVLYLLWRWSWILDKFTRYNSVKWKIRKKRHEFDISFWHIFFYFNALLLFCASILKSRREDRWAFMGIGNKQSLYYFFLVMNCWIANDDVPICCVEETCRETFFIQLLNHGEWERNW